MSGTKYPHEQLVHMARAARHARSQRDPRYVQLVRRLADRLRLAELRVEINIELLCAGVQP